MMLVRAHAPPAALALPSAVALWLASPAAVAAQEYCVSCTGPTALYRCVIEVSKPQGMPLTTLCTTTLAREGGHAACVIKGGTVFDCNGPIRRVTGPPPPHSGTKKGAATPHTASSQAGGAKPQDAAPAKGTTPAAPPSAPPATVEALAKQIGQSSGHSLKKAGEAISGSTTKAWHCLTSFFKTC